ncbi:SSBP3 protein, partial [Polyodon spathula]|nr:SSBP3 protein [Polyodon spathula]
MSSRPETNPPRILDSMGPAAISSPENSNGECTEYSDTFDDDDGSVMNDRLTSISYCWISDHICQKVELLPMSKHDFIFWTRQNAPQLSSPVFHSPTPSPLVKELSHALIPLYQHSFKVELVNYRESVFWDLYCAAPERRDTCEHSSEAKAFHDYVSNPFLILQ